MNCLFRKYIEVIAGQVSVCLCLCVSVTHEIIEWWLWGPECHHRENCHEEKRHLLQQNVASLLSLPLLCSVSCCVAAWSWRLTVFSQKSWNTVHFHSTTGMTSPLFFFLRLGALIERLLFNGHMLNNGEVLCVSKHTHIHLGEVHHTKDPGRHKYMVFKFKRIFKFDIICSPHSIAQLYFVLHSKWNVNHALYSITEKLAKASVL